MTLLNDLMRQLIHYLEQEETLNGICFTEAFLTTERGNPVNRIYAALGLSNVRFLPEAMGEFYDGTSSLAGRRAEIVCKLDLYSPSGLGGPACIDAFSKICDALVFHRNGMCLHSVCCEKMEHDSVFRAFHIIGTIGLTACLVKEELL